MRILHVLHTSLPYVCGYSVRSDRILTFQEGLGFQVSVVTSAQQPEADGAESYPYIRTPKPRLLPSPLRELQLVQALKESVADAVRHSKPDVIHAHSPVLVGLPAYQVARRERLPFVYEVRDLWENASVDRRKFAADSMPYRAVKGLETWLLRRADAVVTICDALRGELAPRIGAEDRLFVVANGVDVESFVPRDGDAAVRERLGIGARPLITYIGAFQPYEGLDLLVRAAGPIAASVPGARIVIVGDGPERPALEQQARNSGVGDTVHFTGRVPYGDVAALYAASDLMVYPRVLTRTTALTTPLKPLEAMAMARCVLASDVPAMREVVNDGVTGALFKSGDVDALAAAAAALLKDPARRRSLGLAGREWVVSDRAWPRLITRYRDVYERARGGAHRAAGNASRG